MIDGPTLQELLNKRTIEDSEYVSASNICRFYGNSEIKKNVSPAQRFLLRSQMFLENIRVQSAALPNTSISFLILIPPRSCNVTRRITHADFLICLEYFKISQNRICQQLAIPATSFLRDEIRKTLDQVKNERTLLKGI